MPNICNYGHLPPRDNNDEDLRIQSPCPSNWSDDLLEIDNNKAKSKEQTEQPTNHIIDFNRYTSTSGCTSTC